MHKISDFQFIDKINKIKKSEEESILEQYGLDPIDGPFNIALQFDIQFKEWTVVPGFLYRDGYDFTLHHDRTGTSLRIAIETMPGDEYKYGNSLAGDWRIDKATGVPGFRISQVLSADYVFWTFSSKFYDVTAQHREEFEHIYGVTRRGTLHKHMFTFAKKDDFSFVTLTDLGVMDFMGENSLEEVMDEIRRLFDL